MQGETVFNFPETLDDPIDSNDNKKHINNGSSESLELKIKSNADQPAQEELHQVIQVCEEVFELNAASPHRPFSLQDSSKKHKITVLNNEDNYIENVFRSFPGTPIKRLFICTSIFLFLLIVPHFNIHSSHERQYPDECDKTIIESIIEQIVMLIETAASNEILPEVSEYVIINAALQQMILKVELTELALESTETYNELNHLNQLDVLMEIEIDAPTMAWNEGVSVNSSPSKLEEGTYTHIIDMQPFNSVLNC